MSLGRDRIQFFFFYVTFNSFMKFTTLLTQWRSIWFLKPRMFTLFALGVVKITKFVLYELFSKTLSLSQYNNSQCIESLNYRLRTFYLSYKRCLQFKIYNIITELLKYIRINYMFHMGICVKCRYTQFFVHLTQYNHVYT